MFLFHSHFSSVILSVLILAEVGKLTVAEATKVDNQHSSLFTILSSNTPLNLPYLFEAPESCPPSQLKAVENFNYPAYIRNRWFIQQQMPVKYQPVDTLFCVSAKYRLAETQRLPLANATIFKPLLRWLRYTENEVRLDVFNYGNRNKVNGPAQIGNLSAVILDPVKYPAQLMVGPSFIPRVFWGPYWVVAAGGVKQGEYDWAIVSGGPPKYKSSKNGYCKTGDGTNDSGLWLFTSEPIVSEDYIRQMRLIAKGLGYDPSVLVPVEQKGCKYDGIQNV